MEELIEVGSWIKLDGIQVWRGLQIDDCSRTGRGEEMWAWNVVMVNGRNCNPPLDLGTALEAGPEMEGNQRRQLNKVVFGNGRTILCKNH